MILTNLLNHIEKSKQFYTEKEEAGEMTKEYCDELNRIKKLEKELEWYFSEF